MPLLSMRDMHFLLFDLLNVESLTASGRYSDHSRETFSQALATAEQIGTRYFLPHNAEADANEPTFDGERVHTLPAVKEAFHHFVEAGLLNASVSFQQGGMQLPATVAAACHAFTTAANTATAAYPFLTIAAANLIEHFASDPLKQRYLPLLRDGRAAGTMALTEPNVGSSLADITTKAMVTEHDHYLISGGKMYISGGDQDITDNIVHLVLARVVGDDPGVKGISLFLVPKWELLEGDERRRNDVKLAGLLHKMGYRGTTSTVLNFGEQGDCRGYLIGERGRGLSYMFMMMNEARIGVGAGAAAMACRGFQESLEYARNRPQGRHPDDKQPGSKPVAIIEHADVKRMLLAQKCYAEGSMALILWANSLVDAIAICEQSDQRQQLTELLDLITPVAKSWPSKYGPEANSLAIQVLGGSGYIREYPVEQLYRDNRLNPIHEGTEGIQGIDLLGRKVWQAGGAGVRHLLAEIEQSAAAARQQPQTAAWGEQLQHYAALWQQTLQSLAPLLQQQPRLGLANATLFLEATGHLMIGWLWLRQALAAQKLAEQEPQLAAGKLAACRFFYVWELPKLTQWCALLQSADDTTLTMRDEWF
jgi:alkylation response protein AidB-like acyl-CoA dehydrogenase